MKLRTIFPFFALPRHFLWASLFCGGQLKVAESLLSGRLPTGLWYRNLNDPTAVWIGRASFVVVYPKEFRGMAFPPKIYKKLVCINKYSLETIFLCEKV